MKLQAEKKEKKSTTMAFSKLERKASFDGQAEPKTLLKEEMNLAREEALRIINTNSKEEALKIFLAGSVAVTSSKQGKEDVIVSDCDEE